MRLAAAGISTLVPARCPRVAHSRMPRETPPWRTARETHIVDPWEEDSPISGVPDVISVAEDEVLRLPTAGAGTLLAVGHAEAVRPRAPGDVEHVVGSLGCN